MDIALIGLHDLRSQLTIIPQVSKRTYTKTWLDTFLEMIEVDWNEPSTVVQDQCW